MNPLRSALSRYFRRPKSGSGRNRTGHRKARRQLPCLEILEDRTVPTAVAAPSGIVSWWAGNGNAATDYVSANTTGLPTRLSTH
jgi:hypothetical protein